MGLLERGREAKMFGMRPPKREEMRLRKRIGNSLLRITRIKEEIRRRYGKREREETRGCSHNRHTHTHACSRFSARLGGVDELGGVCYVWKGVRKEGRDVNRNETGVILQRKGKKKKESA